MDENMITEEGKYFYNPYSSDSVVNTSLLVVTCVLTLVGVIGNTLVIGSVFAYKPLRRLRNFFIVNLAVADLFVSAFINIFGIIGVLTHGEYFFVRPILCELIGIVCITSCSCSLWSVSAISVNRYVAICHRLHYPQIFNRYTMLIIIPSLWGICFCIDLPNLFGWGRHSFDPRIMLCTYDYTESYSYTTFFITIGFGLPLVTLLFCYARIYTYARGVTKEVHRRSSQDGGAVNRPGITQTDRKLLRTLIIVVVAFFTVWTPFVLVALFDKEGTWPRPIYVGSILLMHTSSCINSVLYAATNKLFRRGYMRLIEVSCCKMCFKYKGKSEEEHISTLSNVTRF